MSHYLSWLGHRKKVWAWCTSSVPLLNLILEISEENNPSISPPHLKRWVKRNEMPSNRNLMAKSLISLRSEKMVIWITQNSMALWENIDHVMYDHHKRVASRFKNGLEVTHFNNFSKLSEFGESIIRKNENIFYLL